MEGDIIPPFPIHELHLPDEVRMTRGCAVGIEALTAAPWAMMELRRDDRTRCDVVRLMEPSNKDNAAVCRERLADFTGWLERARSER